jgi:hypothetical protein
MEGKMPTKYCNMSHPEFWSQGFSPNLHKKAVEK